MAAAGRPILSVGLVGETGLKEPDAMAELPGGFVDVPEAIAEMQAGRMIVVVDDEDRENEGDLTLGAEFCTPEAINFMAKYGRG